MSELLRIELVFAMPDEQALIELQVAKGTTVDQAIEKSGIYARFPNEDLASCAAGVWGRPVERDHVVRDGDRVELYRPLTIDPMEARRQRAKAQAKAPDRGGSR